MRTTYPTRSSRAATVAGGVLVLLGAGLIVPALGASAEEQHPGGDDHRVVVCHRVPGEDAYLRSVVDASGVHNHARHPGDVIGPEGRTDVPCPGPTVSQMPEPSEPSEPEATESERPEPSHTARPTSTATPRPSRTCSHTPSTPPTSEPPTSEPPASEPATSEPATTEPATTEPATTEPVTTEPATSEPATSTPQNPGLAVTGSNPLLPLAAGILLVVVGVGAMVLGRPRGSHS